VFSKNDHEKEDTNYKTTDERRNTATDLTKIKIIINKYYEVFDANNLTMHIKLTNS
jgi:hypothetical protein